MPCRHVRERCNFVAISFSSHGEVAEDSIQECTEISSFQWVVKIVPSVIFSLPGNYSDFQAPYLHCFHYGVDVSETQGFA